MSKIPRISGNQMARYLQLKGFVITRRSGSHMTLRNENIVTVVPARNKKLKIGLQLGILGDVKISRDEFVADYDQ